jgi:hypothetical protein
MFWGCFSNQGTGPLSSIIGTMNSVKYMDTLSQALLPQMNQWYPEGGAIYQQDNAPCHKAASVTAFLENEGVIVLTWPPYSPDLSPIENLWAIVKAKVHSSTYNSKDELVAAVLQVWHHDEDVKKACKTLIEGMPRRIQACIAAKGGVLKY